CPDTGPCPALEVDKASSLLRLSDAFAAIVEQVRTILGSDGLGDLERAPRGARVSARAGPAVELPDATAIRVVKICLYHTHVKTPLHGSVLAREEGAPCARAS